MGNGGCCVQKRLEFGVDWISVGSWGGPECQGGQLVSASSRQHPQSPFAAMTLSGSAEDDFAVEVAAQIATDRQHHVYEPAALIPALYDVRQPAIDGPQHITTAVHRKTGVLRQLATFQKPLGASAQDRMLSHISSLQRVSACSDNVVRVLEVFEDYVNVHLLLEHCSGGTAYERILERQYFTEQESALIVRHMLQALAVLHEAKLHHGCLAPDSFRFLNESPQAPLKLVDFGLELKAHRWDAMESVSGGLDLQNPCVPQFYETCKLVFVAPEMAPPHQVQRRRSAKGLPPPQVLLCDRDAPRGREVNGVGRCAGAQGQDILDGEILADVIDEHADWLKEQQQEFNCDYNRKFEVADVWSVGAIAYLLLCGYPPFFAPSRNAILGRIHRGEVSFDPPFWSKISEEAKNFVSGCLLQSCWDRFSVSEALEHPWIRQLADTSPSGSMFTSFMLNLRRFYRTSLVETFVANMLASKLKREEMHEVLRRCKEIDLYGAGFFTASDLKHVLAAVGHGDVGEAVTARFLRTFRHPGESYIDYAALLDSIYLRQQRMFEEELWRHFGRICQSSTRSGGCEADGWLPMEDLSVVLDDPVIVGMLLREIPDSAQAEEADMCRWLLNSIREYCAACGTMQLEFHDLAALLLRFVRLYASAHHEQSQQKPPAQAGVETERTKCGTSPAAVASVEEGAHEGRGVLDQAAPAPAPEGSNLLHGPGPASDADAEPQAPPDEHN